MCQNQHQLTLNVANIEDNLLVVPTYSTYAVARKSEARILEVLAYM